MRYENYPNLVMPIAIHNGVCVRLLTGTWLLTVLFFLSMSFNANAQSQTAYAYSFDTLGTESGRIELADYKGKVVLVVNTASFCGFTNQFNGLQALWEAHQDEGLVVIAVPSGDFRQEAASSVEAKDYCEMNFNVTFPIAELTAVTEGNAHPFFVWAGKQTTYPQWNFYKYLIGRNGELVASFPSSTRPEGAKLKHQLKIALAQGG